MNLRDLQMSVDYATDQAHRAHTDEADKAEEAAERAEDIATRIVRKRGGFRRWLDKHEQIGPFDIYLPASRYDFGGDLEQLMLDVVSEAANPCSEPHYVAAWADSIADRLIDWLKERPEIQKRASKELDAEEE